VRAVTLAFVVALACALAITARAAAAQATAADVLITNGTLYDGSGTPGRRADVALRADRIVFVGDAKSARITAARTIDATGLIVAPGFIDPHTHTQSDLSNASRRANLDYIMQGVTTVATNNDGSGPVRIGALLASWDSAGIGTNALLFVPQGSVRGAVMGMSDKAPTPAQLQQMRAFVERGMREGAFGMSTGLYYAPGSYSTTEEVIELAKVAAAHGGIYDTHQRDESSYTIGLLASVREVLRIGRDAHIPVHFSHIKALGADVWGDADTVIAMIHAAQRDGLTVAACQYPYDASGTSLVSALVPRWAEAGGRDSLLARIIAPATHAKLAAEMRDNLRRRGGAGAMLIVSSRQRDLAGKRLDAIAAVDIAVAHALAQRLRRDVHELNVGCAVKDTVGNRFAHRDAGYLLDHVLDALDVLHVEGRDHVNAGVTDLLDVLPALLMGRPRDVGVRQLVDQCHLRVARDQGLDVHVGEHRSPVPELESWQHFQAADGLNRPRSLVRLDEPDDDVNPPRAKLVALAQHCEGLARPRRRPQVDLELATPRPGVHPGEDGSPASDQLRHRGPG